MTLLINLVRDEEGQDLVEYTLLLAFVSLASAAMVGNLGNSVRAIWTTANNVLANAAASAAS